MTLQRFPTYAALLILGAVSARADLVVFNTFGAGNDYDPAYAFIVGYGWTQGDQFSPSATGELSKIDIALGYAFGSSHLVSLSLFADNSNRPGALLESYTATTTATFGSCCSFLTLTSATNPLLSAGAEYWLIAGGAADSLNVWNWNSIGASALLFSNGLHYTQTAATFRVSESVPEPSGVILFITVLLAFGIAKFARTRFQRSN